MSTIQVHAILDRNEVEQNPLIVAEINAHNGIESWTVESLAAADFTMNGIGFERKTPSDWAQSIMDDRLQEQRMKLPDHYDTSYILYEGNLGDTESRTAVGSGMDPTAQRGAMARTMMEGIPVIPCGNMRLLVDMAVRLARKKSEPTSPYLPRSSIKKASTPVAMQVYGCLPGVGVETAKELYARWPTVVDFVERADKEALMEIDGIGEVTADGIIKAVGQ